MKSKKSALLLSFTSLLLCFAMLAGSTFAWFTDTASTGFTDTATTAVNKIQAGNLDIELQMKDDNDNWVNAEGKTLPFLVKGEIPAEGTQILWEPGCTYYVPEVRVLNKGNLAVKFEYLPEALGVTGKLAEVLELVFKTPVDANGEEVNIEPAVLKPGEASPAWSFGYHMSEKAGNEYQNESATGMCVTVVATQATYEKDSFNDQYDKDAPIVYPAGVTTESFGQATSVEYTDNLGNTVTGDKPAVAAYVANDGTVKYVGDIYAAVMAGASEIYCKKDAALRMRERLVDTNRTPDLTSDLTIYGNGADFQYGQISMNMTAAGKDANITVKVYDAKNIEVWGTTPNDGVTQNIVMENCTNIGGSATGDDGILIYITGKTGTVNVTVKNCHVEKNSSGIYMSTNGSLTVSDSTFVECATGIKSSYKGSGTRTDRIENCVFIKCGCTAEMAGTTEWLKNDSAAIKYKKENDNSTATLNLKNNRFIDTIGDKGDKQIADSVTVVNE